MPASVIIRDTIKEWIAIVQTAIMDGSIGLLARAWRVATHQYRQLNQGNPKFQPHRSFIKGIITNMVSILISLNWQPIMHNLWVDNQGVKLIIDYEKECFKIIANQLIDTRIMFESIRASAHYCGAGMEHGIDWDASLVLLRDFKD